MKLLLTSLIIQTCLWTIITTNVIDKRGNKPITEDEYGTRRQKAIVSLTNKHKHDTITETDLVSQQLYSGKKGISNKISEVPEVNTQVLKQRSGISEQHKAKTKKDKKTKNKRLRRKYRRRRKINKAGRNSFSGEPRRVCKTVSRSTLLTEAVDSYGDIVQILPTIQVDDTIVPQYIHESFCTKENCRCRGVDNDNYESACETLYKYTYAKAEKEGKEGWRLIKVRAGCSCVVRKKTDRGITKILDMIV